MKKFFSIFAFLGVFGLFIVGCGDKSGVAGYPEWVNEPPHVLSAAAAAKIGNSKPNAINVATEKARAELAKNLNVQVETKFKDLTNTDASGNVDGGTTAAIRNSVNELLKGAGRTQLWEDEDSGDIWVLVEVKEENIKIVDEYLRSSKAIDTETSKIISKAVDELIDGTKENNR